MRYTITVQSDGTVVIEIGHDFAEGDVAQLVAAENAARTAAGR